MSELDVAIASLENDMYDVLDYFSREGGQVGNAVPVTFDDKFVDKYRVSRLGRMVKEGEEYVYQAAPRTLPDRGVWQPVVTDYIAQAERFAAGLDFDFTGPTKMSYTIGNRSSGVPHAYEEEVLKYLVREHTAVTLVNPSEGALWRVPVGSAVNVLFDGRGDLSRGQVREICQRRDARLRILEEPVGIVYLGTNGPKNCGKYDTWACLTPNPFVPDFPYERYSIDLRGANVEMSYTRKHGVTQATLFSNFHWNRLNPPQTDQMFFSSKKVSKLHFFFETSEVIEFPRCPVPDYAGVFFITEYPEPDADGYRIDGNTIYDVPSRGETYLQRYNRVALEAAKRGLKPVRLVRDGKYAISFADVEPVMVASRVIRVDGATIYCLGREFSIATMVDDRFNSTAVVYSPGYSTRDALFPVGGVQEVPYEPRKFRFFLPLQGGQKYFVARDRNALARHQLFVLRKMYGHAFTFPHRPMAGSEYTVAHTIPQVLSLLGDQPKVEDPRLCGGIALAEIADLLHLPPHVIRARIACTPEAMVFDDGKTGRVVSVRNVTMTFSTTPAMSLSELWDTWCSTGRVSVTSIIDVEALEYFFFKLRAPVVRVSVGEFGYELVRFNATRYKGDLPRDLVIEDDVFDEYGELEFPEVGTSFREED